MEVAELWPIFHSSCCSHIGTYLINVLWVGDSTAYTAPTITPSSEFTAVTSFFGPQSGATATQIAWSYYVNLLPSPTAQTITLSAATLPANGTSCTIEVMGSN